MSKVANTWPELKPLAKDTYPTRKKRWARIRYRVKKSDSAEKKIEKKVNKVR